MTFLNSFLEKIFYDHKRPMNGASSQKSAANYNFSKTKFTRSTLKYIFYFCFKAMQVQLETFLHKQWDRKGLISWLLLPASAVFLWGAAYRRRKAKPINVGVPVVIVGNIYVGGTGKTPVTIALTNELKARGWNPGVISRGYKGAADSPVEVLPDSNPDIVGDEPLLIKKSTGVPTFVCPKRVEAARALLKAYPAVNVIISDDGLQHYALQRDVELAVVGARGLGNGWVLPAGPLREPPSRLDEVDAIVLNATEDIVDSPTPRYVATSGFTEAVNYVTGETVSLETLSRMQFKKNLKAAAIAGIAVPERFFSMLKAHGLDITPVALPDHYDYSKNPFKDIDADLIFITEKDAVKCRKHVELKEDKRIYVVPLETKLDKFLIDFVEKKIEAASKQIKESNLKK